MDGICLINVAVQVSTCTAHMPSLSGLIINPPHPNNSTQLSVNSMLLFPHLTRTQFQFPIHKLPLSLAEGEAFRFLLPN